MSVLALLQSVTIEGDTAKALGGLLMAAIGMNGLGLSRQNALGKRVDQLTGKIGELRAALLGIDGESGLVKQVKDLHAAKNEAFARELASALAEAEELKRELRARDVAARDQGTYDRRSTNRGQ